MGKYYVSTGNLFVIISRPDIKNGQKAAIEACLLKYDSNTKADSYIRVSEHGFGIHSDDDLFDTYNILKKAGFKFE